MDADDPFRWLEDLDATEAAAWVRDRNADTVADLARGGRFAAMREEIRAVLDADDRIPLTGWHDGLLYNLWRDREHPRGLWRRTSLDGYRKPRPDWQVLIDVDALADREG